MQTKIFFAALLMVTTPAIAKIVVAKKTVHPCPANNGTDLTLPKGAKYQVHAYDPATDTYTVYSTKFTAEGDSVVTLDGLALAVKEVGAAKREIAKKPDDIVDSVYTLDQNLPTMLPKEVEARRGCQRD